MGWKKGQKDDRKEGKNVAGLSQTRVCRKGGSGIERRAKGQMIKTDLGWRAEVG